MAFYLSINKPTTEQQIEQQHRDVPNKPVVPDIVDTPVICPASCKLETDKVLEVLFHDKFADCRIDVAALPINN